ncbi:uncharacterized protein LOC129587080 [Paramacrobiotus metropolitanus]|uniref:uncharacterized protein LOC129587080 n=1 Tax=Paramacrobiotus metropolitanus TaxID=2943436 RepID=UPI00244636FC|nr:uncharacterized protein LOC129587080 [Paramacrobiotus metropolitanus]XP_055336641.1 uncharacterized protein LOC129587080 [Paramacrobiotus metropolitanus]
MPPRTNSKDERSPRSKKATRPEVIAWASRIPETQDAQDMVETFRRSNLAAKISPEQEAASSRSVEATKQLYDDGQILCRALPHAKQLIIPTVAPGKIGDFLNVGRFIEIMQYVYVRDKPGGDRKKRCFDLNFLIQAVTIPDGNIGLYLSVLHWFVRAFNELSQKESDKLRVAEYGIALSSQLDEENDEILACEILRQYLIKVKPNQRTAFSEKMENLLDRLKFIDISECSTDDRVRLLINVHHTLIEDTLFFNVFSEKIGQARNEIRTEKQGLEASIVERNHSLKELEERLKDTELSEPDKEKISGK